MASGDKVKLTVTASIWWIWKVSPEHHNRKTKLITSELYFPWNIKEILKLLYVHTHIHMLRLMHIFTIRQREFLVGVFIRLYKLCEYFLIEGRGVMKMYLEDV